MRTDREIALAHAETLEGVRRPGERNRDGSLGLHPAPAAAAAAIRRIIEHGGTSSPEMASLGQRAMRNPESLSLDEIKSLGACVVGQAPNKKG
jgi:hypothetical protein